MTIRYAVLNEQGHTFTVVLVQKSILDNRTIAEQALHWLQTRCFNMPTALMARDECGIPSAYYGRSDLALLLSRVPLASLPWRETALK